MPMALPEIVVPVLDYAGPVGLFYVVLRNFPPVGRVLLEALAAVVAIFGWNEKLRQRALVVLGKLTQRGDQPETTTSNVPPISAEMQLPEQPGTDADASTFVK
jgi:hypothetical protein